MCDVFDFSFNNAKNSKKILIFRHFRCCVGAKIYGSTLCMDVHVFAVTEPTPGLGREKPLDFIVSGINTHHPILLH